MEAKRRRRILIGVALAGLLLGALGGSWLTSVVQRHRIYAQIARYERSIIEHSRRNDLPPVLVRAVIYVESAGDPLARSGKDAYGLMQIRDIAKREVMRVSAVGDGDLFDPDYNVLVGTTYLRHLLDRFDDDLHLALAAYNAGPTRVASWRRQQPTLSGPELVARFAPKETRSYCRKVLRGLTVGNPVRYPGEEAGSAPP